MLSPSERRAAYPQALSSQDMQTMQSSMLRNKYEVYIVSLYEMDKIIKSTMKSGEQISKELWGKFKDYLNKGASYYASAEDVATVTKIVGALGGIGAKVKIRNYQGKPHIIFSGNPELRKTLTKRVYKLTDAKVVKLALGRTALVNGIKNGGILTVYLLTGYRVIDFFLTDNATLTQLVGSLAVDIVKIGIATGASIVTAMAFTGTAFALFAWLPIAAVIFVGGLTSILLDRADNDLQITNQVIGILDKSTTIAENKSRDFLEEINDVNKKIEQDLKKIFYNGTFYIINKTEKLAIEFIDKKINSLFHTTPRF